MVDSPFVWGSNGEQIPASQAGSNSRRRIAEALIQQGSSTAPFPTGTRGAGLWTQGMARVAQGLLGGYDMKTEDQNDAAREAKTQQLLLSSPALGGASPAVAAAPAAAPSGPTGSLDPETTGYINNAAAKFGVDPEYLKRTAILESGGRADNVNPTSGAAGLFQFMPKTAKEYELTNPLDPEDSAMAAAELARDNRDTLRASLGRNPTNAELYLSHQQGADGASALLANPNAPAVSLLGKYGRAAVMDNGGNERMTGGQFANMWINKYGPSGAPAPGGVATVAAASPQPVQVADAANGPVAMPATAAASPNASSGIARVTAALGAAGGQDTAAAQPQPAPASVAQPQTAPAPVAQPQIPPQTAAYIKQLIANPGTREAGVALLSQYSKPRDSYSQQTDKDGNVWNIDNATGQRTVALQGEKSTGAQKDFEYGQLHPDFVAQQLAKTKAGAISLANIGNVDMNSGATYDKQLAEGLAKSHAALANGVEDASTRARDLAAMQGAVDAIQRNGGSTGGMGQQQALDLKKTINSGANALGIDTPFNENDLSDKEFLTKFNRSIAGAQAKGAVGSRVTNFELSNYLKANPGLDMSLTGNQRLIGIQSQIEQRNIAVGNAIRDATASAIQQNKKIDPVTVQGIITNYDQQNHVRDPVTGQDLTQSYALPEFQGGSNSSLAVGHETNINGIKIKRVN